MGEVTAAIYARVSTEQQTRGNTVASQLALLREKAQAENVRLEPDHTFIDEGYSGSTLVRPALERLRDAVADGRIDRVYILAPDRLARRYAYQVLLVEEFRRSGAEVVFQLLTQALRIDEQVLDRLVALLPVFAQRLADDPLQLRRRVRRVTRERRRLRLQQSGDGVARRLALERHAPRDQLVEHHAQTPNVWYLTIGIDAGYVEAHVGDLAANADLSRFIL